VTLPLRARLAASYTLLVAALLAVLSVASYKVLARQLNADATSRLLELTEGLHGYVRADGGTPSIAFDANDADQATFVHEATRYYQIYDAGTGALLEQSPGLEPLGVHFTPAEVRDFSKHPEPFDITTEYGRFRLSNSVLTRAPGTARLLQVGISLTAIDDTLRRYLELLLWRLPIAIAVAAVAAYWMAGIALAPLSRFAAASSTIDVNSLSQRLPIRGAGDELDDVAGAFNETLARLEHAVTEMRQFSAALAHELRTPLAALRGAIELSLRRTRSDDQQRRLFASQLEDLDKLNRLIDQILTLARAESGQIALRSTRVDLAALGAEVVEQLEPIAQARAIELRAESRGAVPVDGDMGWLQRLMLNLLDNAIKFTPEGGRVTLCVSSDQGAARVDVRDTGIGMTPAAAKHVFEPFFRADPARSSTPDGAGLGLSLAKWIVEGHRGRIAVDTRIGQGSTFTVWLPVVARQP